MHRCPQHGGAQWIRHKAFPLSERVLSRQQQLAWWAPLREEIWSAFGNFIMQCFISILKALCTPSKGKTKNSPTCKFTLMGADVWGFPFYWATHERQQRSDTMWSTGEGNGKPLQYSCLENPVNSMKRQNDRILKEELHRSVGAQYATWDQWRNNSRKNEGLEPKKKNNIQLWMWLVIEARSDVVKSNIA